jgi:hypothetical protein
MRYVLHFNPEGTSLLGTDGGSIEFAKLPKTLSSGATTKVRVGNAGKHAFTPRDEYGTRYGAAVSEAVARDAGLKGRKRYTLSRSGRSDWFNLVPESNIGKKAKRIDGPGVSVSVIER